MNENDLIYKALKALPNAYAPYSGYKVGAALLTAEGQVFTGVNVENASYGLTICAERNALFAAISSGCRNFVALAVVADGSTAPVPCGACRQVLSEFCGGLSIIIGDREKHYFKTSLQELFPQPFGSDGRLKE